MDGDIKGINILLLFEVNKHGKYLLSKSTCLDI